MREGFENHQHPSIQYVEDSGSTAMRRHFHNAHQMLFIVDGQVHIKIQEKDYACKENTVVLISNCEPHHIAIAEYPYKRYILSFPVNFISNLLADSSLFAIFIERQPNFSHAVALRPDAASALEALLQKMMGEYERRQPHWARYFASLLTELLITIYRGHPGAFPLHHPTNIVKIIREIQQQISLQISQAISLDALASQYFISPSYLSRSFKKVTGYHFRGYLTMQRVSVAKELLIHTDLPVTELCGHVGYSSVNHFIRIFKQLEGVTPYRYKLSHTF